MKSPFKRCADHADHAGHLSNSSKYGETSSLYREELEEWAAWSAWSATPWETATCELLTGPIYGAWQPFGLYQVVRSPAVASRPGSVAHHHHRCPANGAGGLVVAGGQRQPAAIASTTFTIARRMAVDAPRRRDRPAIKCADMHSPWMVDQRRPARGARPTPVPSKQDFIPIWYRYLGIVVRSENRGSA